MYGSVWVCVLLFRFYCLFTPTSNDDTVFSMRRQVAPISCVWTAYICGMVLGRANSIWSSWWREEGSGMCGLRGDDGGIGNGTRLETDKLKIWKSPNAITLRRMFIWADYIPMIRLKWSWLSSSPQAGKLAIDRIYYFFLSLDKLSAYPLDKVFLFLFFCDAGFVGIHLFRFRSTRNDKR